ncbi:hypothetical protein HY571_00750 [Candidatus Micrarchaeota archaeon]|nr:hypothetical protein [Candidatus Micrarchaeota archaeon]
MSVMKSVVITKLPEARPDDRGQAFDLPLPKGNGLMYITRKAGTISGKHFHEGKTAGKSPEVIILLSGKAEFYCKDLKTKEEMSCLLEAPVKVEVNPFVWHELKALTDIAILELSSLQEHKQDTVREMPK